MQTKQTGGYGIRPYGGRGNTVGTAIGRPLPNIENQTDLCYNGTIEKLPGGS